jgi:hypothetical protein
LNKTSICNWDSCENQRGYLFYANTLKAVQVQSFKIAMVCLSFITAENTKLASVQNAIMAEAHTLKKHLNIFWIKEA